MSACSVVSPLPVSAARAAAGSLARESPEPHSTRHLSSATSAAVQEKILEVTHVMAVDAAQLSAVLRRAPSVLSRRPACLTAMRAVIEQHVGSTAAAAGIMRKCPEVRSPFRCPARTLEYCGTSLY